MHGRLTSCIKAHKAYLCGRIYLSNFIRRSISFKFISGRKNDSCVCLCQRQGGFIPDTAGRACNNDNFSNLWGNRIYIPLFIAHKLLLQSWVRWSGVSLSMGFSTAAIGVYQQTPKQLLQVEIKQRSKTYTNGFWLRAGKKKDNSLVSKLSS